jgi:hypothetical protein
MPIIPALQRLRQEDHDFEANLDCMMKPCWKRRREGGRKGGKERGKEGRKERGREGGRKGGEGPTLAYNCVISA